MNADTTTAAAAAHRAATEEHARASRNFGATDAELLGAIAARDALLAQAEDGAAVGTSDVRQAEDGIRQAEAAALLAKAIHSGARRRMEMAEISVLRERAGQHVAGWHAAVRSTINAARRVDDALAIAQSAMAELNAAWRAQSHAHGAACAHDTHVKDRTLLNQTLAGLEDSDTPWASRSMQMHRPLNLTVGAMTSMWGETQPVTAPIAGMIGAQYLQHLPPEQQAEVLADLGPGTQKAA